MRARAARSGTTSGRARRAWSATPPAASIAASAVAGDRVFMVTDHAHLIALNRFTGALLWDTEMADWRQNYDATGAPLVVGDLVDLRHRRAATKACAASSPRTIRRPARKSWRFWTVPAPGEPGSETWQGRGIEHPRRDDVADRHLRSRAGHCCTGRPAIPCPDYDGDERERRQPLLRLDPRARSRRPAS